ncbi:E3 ubiquitin-protein ligase TRIM71 [Geodia barretti]|nr:E3 ubiquitin-protein ligase TRIM71 [Geodia barretti]
MYVDKRDLEEDTIDKWDEEKLKEVVQKKHGGKTKQKTDIVCKHFLHAVEKGIYGWFWECPNSERCIYRHALPPGFVFKKMGSQTNDAVEETITIEELVENDRQQLAMSGKNLTPVTLDSFKAWKERKLKEKKDKLDASATKKKEAFVAGRTHGISGREMFEFNPDLVQGDDQEAGEDTVLYSLREEDGEGGGREVGEEEEEGGEDITEMVGYLDEVVAPPPPPVQSSVAGSSRQAEAASELDLYCETCKEVICRDCIVRLHRDHQYDLVSDVFQQQKEVLVSSVEPAEQQLASVGKALEDLKAEIRLGHQALEAREEVLITQLDQMTREKLKNLAAQQEQLELVATRLQSCCGFFRETLRTGSQIEVLAMAKPSVQQVRDVMSSLTPESLVPQEKADLDFASSQRELVQICKQFGEVYNSTICPPKCIAEGVGLRFAVVGELAVATLKMVGQKGREYRHPVEVSLAVVSSDGSTGGGESKRMGGSRYVIGYLPWHGGLNYLHIRVEGEHISGSPFPVSVITDTPTIIAGVTRPWGSALDKDDQLVVSEFGKHCLSVFSSDGRQKKSFGTFGSGPGQLNHPCGVAFSATGDILVADQFNHRIQVFSPEGKSVKCVGTKGNGRLQFNCPVGITVHPGSKKLYVADSDNNRVHVRNADLTFCSTFGSEGVGNGQFNNPLGVGFDAAGNLYVTDSDNHRVQVFTENGEYIRQFGKEGSSAGELCKPRGVAIDSNNIVYVGDFGNHRISIFSGEGEFLGIGGDRGSGPGQFKCPSGVTISSHGCIYVSDRGNNRIQVF